MRGAPARRYAYYLTPQGFAEKSRLTVEYLSRSFGFFRQAKTECTEVFCSAEASGVKKMVFAGQSDLAEIAAIRAIERGIEVVGAVQDGTTARQFIGLHLFNNYGAMSDDFDAVLITEMTKVRETYETATARMGAKRVLIPKMLRIGIGRGEAMI